MISYLLENRAEIKKKKIWKYENSWRKETSKETPKNTKKGKETIMEFCLSVLSKLDEQMALYTSQCRARRRCFIVRIAWWLMEREPRHGV
jgi:hypothetical protein